MARKSTVAILGAEGVGKSSFINSLLNQEVEGPSQELKLSLFSRAVPILVYEHKPYSKKSARTYIILYSLVKKETLEEAKSLLKSTFELHSMSSIFVIGTHSDLKDQRAVPSSTAVSKELSSIIGVSVPYFETTATKHPVVLRLFQEIIARLYINEEVFLSSPKEAENFAINAMDWCLKHDRFEILAHLHSLGYSLPSEFLDSYPLTVGRYLMQIHPPEVVPNFKINDLSNDPYIYENADDFGELYDLETSMKVEDSRMALSVNPGWSLMWSDLSLYKCPAEMLLSLSNGPSPVAYLVNIDLSHNRLSKLPVEIFRLQSLESLNVSFNEITRIQHPVMWYGGPKVLLASHNRLENVQVSAATQQKLASDILSSPSPRLWHADLSHNNYTSIPQSLMACRELQSLNMEENPGLKTITPDIASLPRISNLILSPETVVDPPAFVISRGPKHLLHHLRGQIDAQVLWNRFRIVMLGPQMSGKSSLASNLGATPPFQSKAKKGIVIHDLKLTTGDGIFHRSWLNIDIWEFEEGFPKARDTLYSSFSCHQSVHVLVYDVQRDSKYGPFLQYLANMQSRSPHPLPVIVVFTHTDLLMRDSKEAARTAWKELLDNKSSSTGPMLLMPNIIGIHFVSNKTAEGIAPLKKQLQRIFSNFSDHSLNPKEILGLGLYVPKSYLAVDEAVHQIRCEERKKQSSKRIPLFVLLRVENLVTSKSSEVPQEDVEPALWFLHEMGIIFMFKLEGTTLVCPDPILLAELLVKLLKATSIEERGKPQGFHEGSHLKMLWGTESVGVLGVSPHLLMSVLQESQLFSPINSACIITPHFLDSKTPRTFCSMGEYLRVYHFDYLPFSLMPKYFCALIRRIVGEVTFSFASPEQTLCNNADAGPLTENTTSPTPSFTVDDLKVTIWSTGIELKKEDSGIQVLEGKVTECSMTDPDCSGVVKFCVWGSSSDKAKLLRLMCGVLNETVEKWYPGLLTPRNDFTVSISIPVDTTTSPILKQPKEEESVSERLMDQLPYREGNDRVLYYPLYEVLKRFLHTPEIHILERTVRFQDLVPDYACSDHLSVELEVTQGPAANLRSASIKGGYFVREFPEFLEVARASKKICSDMKRMLQLGAVFDMFREYLTALSSLQSKAVVSLLSYSMSPPIIKMERAPCGCLRDLLQQSSSPLRIQDIHTVTLQIIAAVEYLHALGIHDACICSEHILVWNNPPISVKLSDETAPPQPHTCEMCIEPKEVPSYSKEFREKGSVIQLGILLYELATGKRPFEGIYTPSFVITAILHGSLALNVEAQIQAHNLNLRAQSNDETAQLPVTGCHRMCLQSIIDSCMTAKTSMRPTLRNIRDRLCLCVGPSPWAPCRMAICVECIYCTGDSPHVYWASGSRGLIVGHFDPDTGENFHHIILEAPIPSSGMFANRKGKPVPLAVGHATCLTVVKATKQLWVGTEDGSKGSLHVFDVTDWSNHHSIHLQDAVLSILALNNSAVTKNDPTLGYRVFVGLANGTIIIFTGMLKDKVAALPLQSQRKVIITRDRGPCLDMTLDPNGKLWFSRGDSIEVMDPVTLMPDSDLEGLQMIPNRADLPVTPLESSMKDLRERIVLPIRDRPVFNRSVSISYKPKPEIITQLAASASGVWSVMRRSSKVYCWDLHSGKYKTVYDVSSAIEPPIFVDEITVIRVQGRVLWVGSRTGYILVLDIQKVGSGEPPLLGIQYCGEGRIKDICPLYSSHSFTARLRAVCSLEHYNEISGLLMTWEYHHHYDIDTNDKRGSSTAEILVDIAIEPKLTQLSMDLSTGSNEEVVVKREDSGTSENPVSRKEEAREGELAMSSNNTQVEVEETHLSDTRSETGGPQSVTMAAQQRETSTGGDRPEIVVTVTQQTDKEPRRSGLITMDASSPDTLEFKGTADTTSDIQGGKSEVAVIEELQPGSHEPQKPPTGEADQRLRPNVLGVRQVEELSSIEKCAEDSTVLRQEPQQWQNALEESLPEVFGDRGPNSASVGDKRGEPYIFTDQQHQESSSTYVSQQQQQQQQMSSQQEESEISHQQEGESQISFCQQKKSSQRGETKVVSSEERVGTNALSGLPEVVGHIPSKDRSLPTVFVSFASDHSNSDDDSSGFCNLSDHKEVRGSVKQHDDDNSKSYSSGNSSVCLLSEATDPLLTDLEQNSFNDTPISRGEVSEASPSDTELLKEEHDEAQQKSENEKQGEVEAGIEL